MMSLNAYEEYEREHMTKKCMVCLWQVAKRIHDPPVPKEYI